MTGYRFETGLVDVILDDAMAEPGALPLLQNALLQLWERRKGALFTHAAYTEIGGLEGAIERQAEKVYDELDSEEKRVCQRMLLRLIQPGQGTEATKRRAPLRELESEELDRQRLDRVTATLTAPETRLLVTHGAEGGSAEPTIELSHEAIIRNWKRLRDWIDENRQGIVIRRRLTDAASEWRTAAFDEGFLYRGPRLTEALAWAESHEEDLNEEERGFLQKSAENAAEEEFGDERLVECCRNITAGIDANGVADRVMQAVAQWSGGSEQFDDRTVVVLEIAS